MPCADIPNGEEAAIAASGCEAICPAQAITSEAGPRPQRRYPAHHRYDIDR